jgi:uncharacterized protein YggE
MSTQKSVVGLLGAVVVLALVLASAPAILAPTAAYAQMPQGTITVVGEARIKVTPDTAQATIGVEVVKPTVKEASTEATRLMNSLMDVLKQMKIAEKDIQTSSFSVWLDRPYNQDGTYGDAVYHVSNQVNVTVHELDKVDDVLDATMVAGANNIYGVTFSVSDTSQVEAEARQKAVDNARAKAKVLAQLTGLALGEVISVSEVIGGGTGGYYSSNLQPASAGMGGGGGGPISPGEMEISVQLQIVYSTVQ